MPRFVLALCALAALVACETVEGFGRDVESGGQAIQETSNEVQAEI